MPETPFTIQLPDGTNHSCYSPSSIVTKYFTPGDTLTTTDFLTKATQALTEANQRVIAKFGFGCSGAQSSLIQIHNLCEPLPPDAPIKIIDL